MLSHRKKKSTPMNVCEWLKEVCSRKHFESSNSVAKNYISIRSFTIDCWDTDMVTDVHCISGTSVWALGSLRARITPLALCHVPQAIHEMFLERSLVNCSAGRCRCYPGLC